MKMIKAGLALCLTLSMATAWAGEAEVRASIQGKINGAERADIVPSPIPGYFEVSVDMEIYYVSDNGQFLFTGEAIDLMKRASLTEPVKRAKRLQMMKAVDDSQTIIFSPKGEVKHRINVFTDIDCHYCQVLHNEMEGYLARGIEVRYLFFPRAGIGSASAKKAESVWCADDRHDALTKAKKRQPIPTKQCANPVVNDYVLGQKVGVRGTPSIVTDTGKFIGGYLAPSKMLANLEQD